VIPGLTIIPEVAFSTGAGDVGYLVLDDASRGKLDTAKLAAADYFVDVSTWLRGATVNRGVSRFEGIYGRAEAGTLTVALANEDRRFDPTNLAGPYVAAGATQVKAGRAIRLRATWDGVAYDLFRGFIDEPRLTYVNPGLATTTLLATDGTAAVANYDQNGGGVVGTGETTGARIGRVLDNLGWPAEERNIAVGDTTVQGTDLSANAWSEIALTSDTEMGEVYFDVDGKLTFRNRNATSTDTRSNTSQATFGDAGDGVELGFVDIELATDLNQTRNIIRGARVGGVQQTAEDATSIAEYRRRTWQRSDLLHETDTEVADYVAFVLSLLKDNELRVSTMTVDPRADPDLLFPEVLGRRLGDRVTVKFTPPGGGARISRDVFIRGITHTIGLTAWSTTFAFQDATNKFQFFVLDNATLGRLDANALAY
jgi:hypothetical protein